VHTNTTTSLSSPFHFFKMSSYASRFTSNRFAALDDEVHSSAAAPIPPVAAPTTRVWLPSTTENTSNSRGSIFRRGNQSDTPVHSAFQGMRGGAGGNSSDSAAAASTSGGFQQVGGRSNGYKSIFAKPEAPPAPKTYEDEYPSLGGGSSAPKPKVAPLPKKTGFADLAKSWAKASEEEAAAFAEKEKEERRERAMRERTDALYERLVITRRSYIPTEPEFDYNEDAPRNREDDFSTDPYRGAGRASPYSPPHSPHTHHDYAEDVGEDDDDY
jgi:hypothetical protein